MSVNVSWIAVFAVIFFLAVGVGLLSARWQRRPDQEVELEAARVKIRPAIVVLSVVTITILALLASFAIAFFGPDPLTSAQAELQATLNTIVIAGTGALVGFLGGKK